MMGPPGRRCGTGSRRLKFLKSGACDRKVSVPCVGDHAQQTQALAAYFMEARQTWAFAPEKLRLLLAGLLELLPWRPKKICL